MSKAKVIRDKLEGNNIYIFGLLILSGSTSKYEGEVHLGPTFYLKEADLYNFCNKNNIEII